MDMNIRFFAFPLVASVFLLPTGAATLTGQTQQDYKFTSIADTNGQFSGFAGGTFTVNSAGAVAFSAPLKAGGRGIYRSVDGQSYTKIVKTGDELDYSTGQAARPAVAVSETAFMNNSGQVGFHARFSELNEAVFIGNGSTPVRDAVPFYYDLTSPSINDPGDIAWTGFFGFVSTNPPSNSSRFYVLRSPSPGESGEQGSAGAIIAHTGGNEDGNSNITGFFSGFGGTAINDGGTVAFRATIRSGGEGIFAGKEALPDRFGAGHAKTTLIADNVSPGSQFRDFGSSTLRPDISDTNVVVFGANLKSGGHGIFRCLVGGIVSTVADTSSGAYTQINLNPATNASGQVAFTARRPDGRIGIYLGPDPSDVVVETGKALFGSVVNSLATGPRTLSDDGKVAFFYQLTDGRRGVAIAIPNGEKKPTGDLVIKESTEPVSAYSTYGLFLRNPSGGQLREVSFEPEPQSEVVFDVELTNTKAEEETYVLTGTETGTSGWTVQALFGTADNWPAFKGGGGSIKLQPGGKLRFKMRLTGADPSQPLPGGSKRQFTISVRAQSDISFTHDALAGIVEAKFGIVVNSTADSPDADPNDDFPDVDLEKEGLQTTLRCALEFIKTHPDRDLIKFKIPAEDPGISNGVALIKPQTPLPTITTKVTIDGSTQDPGSATPPIELDGVDLPRPDVLTTPVPPSREVLYDYRLSLPGVASGLVIDTNGCKLRGLALIHFPLFGLEIKGDHNAVRGCHIGIDAKGKLGSANGIGGFSHDEELPQGIHTVRGAGIVIRSSFNQIGGTTPRDRNVISGTSGTSDDIGSPLEFTAPGVVIAGSGVVGNMVAGNYFGLDSSGEALPQVGGKFHADSYSIADIVIYNARANLIGGIAAGSGNFFANHGTGVLLLGQDATSNLLQGNQFGRSASGSGNFPKSVGIEIENARNNDIGGIEPGAGNDIAGGGIHIKGSASKNQCFGNTITNFGNNGIQIGESFYNDKRPSDILIEANEISFGGGFAGIVADGAAITVKGNSIHDQVRGPGVFVFDGSQVRITGNQIYRNGGLGIALEDRYKPTLNDFGDSDGGANGRMNFPVLGKAIATGGSIHVEGSLDTKPGSRAYQVEFFANGASPYGYGEGERFLGATNVTTDLAGYGTFNFALNAQVIPGEFVSATATDPDGNTSEFSRVVQVRSGNDLDNDGVDDEVEARVPNRASPSGQLSRRTATENAVRAAGPLTGFPSPDTHPIANTGDGNGDGILDSQQANVASFLTIVGEWVTLVSPAGTTLEGIVPSGPPDFANLPPNANFPVGFVNFSVGGLTPGGTVAVNCIFHEPVRYTTAYAYGPHEGATEPGWYEFNYNGQTGAIPRSSELTLHFVDSARGDHDLQANGRINTLLAPAGSTAGQLLNISTRLGVLTGENVLIGGLIVSGADAKRVLLRAIGPSLGLSGVAGALADPTLELYDSAGELVVSNDNWQSSQKAEIEATTIPPSDARESAIVHTLAPGAYTAVVAGSGGGTGVGLVEAYDLDRTANSDLVNISTRGLVGAGDNVMIGGLIVGGNGGPDTRVLVRAIGPSLANAGIGGGLPDPTLELVDGHGNVVGANDDWRDSQQGEIEETTIPPTHPSESAIVTTLPPGNYTAVVRGADGGTGVGLVEVYNLQ